MRSSALHQRPVWPVRSGRRPSAAALHPGAGRVGRSPRRWRAPRCRRPQRTRPNRLGSSGPCSSRMRGC